MTITLESIARNAAVAAIGSLVDAGDFHFRAATTPLLTITTAATAFGAPSTGTIALAGTPRSAAASAGGTVDNFLARTSGSAPVFSGSCTGTGGGGDIEFDNPLLTLGQNVNFTAFSLTVPAS